MEVNLKSIGAICRKYTNLDLYKVYLGRNIPYKMNSNAVRWFPLTNAKFIYLLYDSSTFGNGKTGIAICDNGVFYKNDPLNQPWYKHFSWEEFSALNIYIKDSNIFFGNEYYVYFPTVMTTVEAMAKLLKEIQQSLLNGGKYNENFEQSQGEGASNGDKLWRIVLGPMGSPQIEKLLLGNFFDPNVALVEYGDGDWRTYNTIPELKALAEGLNNKTDQSTVEDNHNDNKKSEASKKIDINTCKVDDLLSIDCMDMQRINCLMEKRRSGNKFYALEDVAELLDLKPHEVEELKDKIEFNLSKMLNGVRRIEF